MIGEYHDLESLAEFDIEFPCDVEFNNVTISENVLIVRPTLLDETV